MDRALSRATIWRPLLIIAGALLVLFGLYKHDSAFEVAGFIIAIFGVMGGG